jgi:hypothetical protein
VSTPVTPGRTGFSRMLSDVSTVRSQESRQRPPRAERRARSAIERALTAAERETFNQMFPDGVKPGFIESEPELRRLVENASDLNFKVQPVDNDGDIPIEVSCGQRRRGRGLGRRRLLGRFHVPVGSTPRRSRVTTRVNAFHAAACRASFLALFKRAHAA